VLRGQMSVVPWAAVATDFYVTGKEYLIDVVSLSKRARGWLVAPEFPGQPLRTRQAATLHAVLLGLIVIILGLVAATPAQPGAHIPSIVTIYTAMVALHFACFALLRNGRVGLSGAIYVSALWLIVTAVIGTFGGMTGQSGSIYLVVVMVAAFTLGGGWGLFFAGLSVASAATFVLIDDLLPPPPVDLGAFDAALALTAGLVGCALVTYLALRNLHSALGQVEHESSERAHTVEELRHANTRIEMSAARSDAIAQLGLAILEVRGEDELCARAVEALMQSDDIVGAAVLDLSHDGAVIAQQSWSVPRDRLPEVGGPEAVIVSGREALGHAGHSVVLCAVPRRESQGAVLGAVFQERLAPASGVAFVEGVTRLLATALARESLDERVERFSRLEALGQLAGGVAHDFNNLLVVINGSVDLLSAELPAERPDLKQLIGELGTAGDRAADLTRQLLAFAQPVADASSAIRPADVIQELQQLLGRLFDERIRLEVQLAGGVPAIQASRSELHQVLLNLCVNARDAMPDGGILTIRARPETRPDGSRGALIEVADTGTGLAPEARRRMFEPFFTTKPRGQGSGLGLALVWGAVTGAGGTVQVQSVPGEGTRFDLWWPEAEEKAASTDETSRNDERISGLVLLVDDDLHVRRTVARLVTRTGCVVMEASNGREALERLSESTPDLVLTDVSMPELDGPGLARVLRERLPELPVVFMTGYADEPVRDGPTLVKPFNSKDMTAMLRRLMPRSA
jgi:signal transduction histidine kinase